MATPIAEKLKAFRAMFGGNADQILKDAESVEKEADKVAEYKEADTPETLKAMKKAAPKQVEIDLEEETPEEEEAAETEEEEMAEPEAEQVEEEAEGTEMPVKKGKKKDDDEALEDDEFELDESALGLMDVKEYGALMADVLEAGLLEPIAAQLTALKEALVDEFRQTVAAHKERQDEGMRLAADAAVDHEARLSLLEKENKALKAKLKELTGDLPRTFARGYVASEDDDTIIPDGDPRLKEGPSADPLATFADQFILTGIK